MSPIFAEVVGLQRRLKPLQDQLASKRRQQAELATRVLGMQAEVQDLEALMAQVNHVGCAEHSEGTICRLRIKERSERLVI